MVQLADMSFADILKADRLKELKKDHELYVQKFREAYGHDPSYNSVAITIKQYRNGIE